MNQEDIENALPDLKSRLRNRFGRGVELYLFGSVARGDYDEESDIDVLVLIPGVVNNSIEEEISDEAFEVGLNNDVVFGTIVYSCDFWKTERARVMPLYVNIQEESVKL